MPGASRGFSLVLSHPGSFGLLKGPIGRRHRGSSAEGYETWLKRPRQWRAEGFKKRGLVLRPLFLRKRDSG
jgi:hypothetical protein